MPPFPSSGCRAQTREAAGARATSTTGVAILIRAGIRFVVSLVRVVGWMITWNQAVHTYGVRLLGSCASLAWPAINRLRSRSEVYNNPIASRLS